MRLSASLPYSVRDVVLRDGAPMHVAVARARPSLDAGEQAFDARAVAVDAIFDAIHRSQRQRLALPLATFFDHHRHQILRAGKDEDIGFVRVVVSGQALFGLAGDLRQPSDSSRGRKGRCPRRSRSSTKLRAESRAAGRSRDGHSHGSGAGHGIGGELLADPANSAAAFRKRDSRRLRKRRRLCGIIRRVTTALRCWNSRVRRSSRLIDEPCARYWTAEPRKQALFVKHLQAPSRAPFLSRTREGNHTSETARRTLVFTGWRQSRQSEIFARLDLRARGRELHGSVRLGLATKPPKAPYRQ